MKNSKFIQIAVDPADADHNGVIYALDASGTVWQYDRSAGTWFHLSAQRSTEEHPKAKE